MFGSGGAFRSAGAQTAANFSSTGRSCPLFPYSVVFICLPCFFRRLLLGYPGVYFLWLGLSRPAGESRLLVIFLSPFFITRHILPFRVRRRVLHQPPAVATLIMSSVTCWDVCCGRPLLDGRRASGLGRQL